MYATFSNSYPPGWSSDDGSAPVVSYFSKLSEEDIRAEIGDYYLDYVDVKWIDIPESSSSDDASIAPMKSKSLRRILLIIILNLLVVFQMTKYLTA